VSEPHCKTVVVVDLESAFDATRLSCSQEGLRHVHIYRPPRGSPTHVREMIAGIETWMLYGDHSSTTREWWGTIVLGGIGAGDVNAGWKGWLKVEREEVGGFAVGLSAQEAFESREKRQDVVDQAGWTATSSWGSFIFQEGLQVQKRQVTNDTEEDKEPVDDNQKEEDMEDME
jgi:hypothetical protein